MNTRHSTAPARPWWVMPAACLATVLALPVNAGVAFNIPDDPLTTGVRVAPNILFILDDSGSMAFNYMPDDVPGTTTTNIASLAYPRNTLSYNPAVTYLTWTQSDGSRMTGGTDYSKAYGDSNLVGGWTANLGAMTTCNVYSGGGGSYSGGGGGDDGNSDGGGGGGGGGYDPFPFTTLKLKYDCGGIRTYYVPKDVNNQASFGDGSNYYRFQIMPNGSNIQRGVFGKVTGNSGNETVAPAPTPVPAAGNVHTLTGHSAKQKLFITIKNKENSKFSTKSIQFFVKRPDNTEICRGQVNAGRGGSCNIWITDAGNYTVTIQPTAAADTNAAYDLTARWVGDTNSCDPRSSSAVGSSDWVDCAANVILPNATRTLSQELANYATWYSYHRTRIKVAKAGAGDAFAPLGSSVRVGLRTIWGRAANNTYPIPVGSGDGRFMDDSSTGVTNRSQWYTSLYSREGKDNTPLRSALQQAGDYFSNTSKSGPYGPEDVASQFSCRQNFTILTTDGYWNQDDSYSSVDEQDNESGKLITGPGGKSYQYLPKAPYSSADKDTLADVAMKYWKTDLRSDLLNNVPTTTNDDSDPKNGDPAFWQHMVTFGISIGLKTTAGWSNIQDAGLNPAWPNPHTEDPNTDYATRVDDLLHAAMNGHGTFVSASNPEEFVSGLKQALANIAKRTSSFSNVSTNAASIKAGGKVFNASYVSGIWTGAIKAWNLDANNAPSTLAWAASIPAFASRRSHVFTYNGTGGASFPTAAQTTMLDRSGGGVSNFPVSGANNANYIMGDTSLEGSNPGQLRQRESLLGDIVNSSPVYVADTDTLYAGANDGMLHAFDAKTGIEQFAYVPNLLTFSTLAQISRGDYTHKWSVDGPQVVTSRALTPSENWLVGSIGRGGKGMYGLDVSTPGAFSTTNVKWEMAETPLNNMGLVTGRPVLAKIKSGTAAAIVGNGVNSANNHAVLLVINIKTGAVIKELDTGEGSAATPNGLSAPTAILGEDGKSIAYAYAGDRLGNVWKFDMRDALPSKWTIKKLFTAKASGGSGAVQPIAGGLTVATDPKTFKRWVFFGTGSYLTSSEADDKTSNAQGMYGIIDDDKLVNYSDLDKRTIINTGAVQNGYPVRTFEAKADLSAGKLGWYLSLPGAGERIVQDAMLVSNIMITASMIPEGDACEMSGSGYINAIDAFTGTSLGNSFFDLDGNPATKSEVNGISVGSVNYGVGMPTLPVLLDGKLIVGGTNAGDMPGAGGIARRSWGRVSWREIREN